MSKTVESQVQQTNGKAAETKVKVSDFKTGAESWWCPGCGDFGVLASLQKALVNLQLQPHEVAMVAGIGCSGKIGNYVNSYNVHAVHGRTLPAAMGLKLANRDLTVLAAGGDGDGFAIGMGHFMHALRRNVDMTYIVMDNHIYGLTKGQVSPTSDPDFVTRSSPSGNIERPVSPVQLAVAAGGTFVAQGFSSDVRQLSALIEAGIRHRGFALINAISPCPTFNKVNTFDWYKEVLSKLEDDPTYDSGNRVQALERLINTDGLVTGIIFQGESQSYEDRLAGFKDEPIVKQDWTLPKEEWEKLLAELA